MNTFGQLFRVTTFGESHGVALGAVIDGCPAGVSLDAAHVQRALDRRRPGQSVVTTARAEADTVELVSGVFEGKTLGTPIAMMVRNQDARSADYEAVTRVGRRGHADAAWLAKYGHVDWRGGGRSSGRETVSRVMAGAVAEALLQRESPAVSQLAWVAQVGPWEGRVVPSSREEVDAHPTRCPDVTVRDAIGEALVRAKANGDSYGGAIDVEVRGLPVGLGEPVFGKLKSRLADAWVGIGAAFGVHFGPPDLGALVSKSGANFHGEPGLEVYGGVQGGLSNGEPLRGRVYFKPPSTLGTLAKAGRHDPCILPRAVAVVEAMTWLVLADLWLLHAAHAPRRGTAQK